MTKAQELYHKIASEIPDTQEGKMFGALCIKAPNGKAGVMFWKEFMIFKLSGTDQEKALKLKDAKIFTPMEGRPMGGWVQLSEEHSKVWKKYAVLAMDEVRKIEVVAKKSPAKKQASNKKAEEIEEVKGYDKAMKGKQKFLPLEEAIKKAEKMRKNNK